MKSKIFTFVIFLLIIVLADRISAATDSIHETETSKFKIEYPNGQDRPHGLKDHVSVQRNKDKTVITISSEFGIGTVKLFLNEGSWPEKIVTHLYLKGLEGFSVTNGEITFERHEVTIKAFDKNSNLLNQKQCLKQVRFYEVVLPSSLFDKETENITISWVDFYRA